MNIDILRQKEFLERVKHSAIEGTDYIEELMKILSVSRSSIYKRIRGDVSMRLTEIEKVSQYFGVAFDDTYSLQDENHLTFQSTGFLRTLSDVKSYLTTTLQLISTEADTDYKFYYGARDLPLFHYFFSDDLARFKIAVWLQDFNPKALSIAYGSSDEMLEILELGRNLYKYYTAISTTELWTDRTIVNLMNQINTFRTTGKISNDEAVQLCYTTDRLLENIRKSAESGEKKLGGAFEMYRIGFLMMTNSALYASEGRKIGFISYAGINYLTSAQKSFCDNMEEWFKGQIANSEALHLSNGFKRDAFFSKAFRRVDILKRSFDEASELEF
jgi:hypothetical protein